MLEMSLFNANHPPLFYPNQLPQRFLFFTLFSVLMDSSHPHSQSSSYVGLLTSQDESIAHGNFPYESYHSSVNFGASEIPPFSSQQAPPPTQDTPVKRGKRNKWSPADDEVLISAWLNTSKDTIVGNDQKYGTFWRRVGEYYDASPHATARGDKRSHQNCKQRWQKINELTNKFCAAFAAAERQQSSGQNETDLLKKAHDIFFRDHDVKFNLEHAWCVLRHEQKWLSLNTIKATITIATAKRKNAEKDTQASSSEVGMDQIRPEGIKAAKARRNNRQGKAHADYKDIWEIKKEDLEKKEKLSKLAILDTLLNKKEPLSEAEEVVKNKLLALYF